MEMRLQRLLKVSRTSSDDDQVVESSIEPRAKDGRDALNQMRASSAAKHPSRQRDHERHMFVRGGNIYIVLLGHILVQHINSLAGKPFILHFSLYGVSPNPMG